MGGARAVGAVDGGRWALRLRNRGSPFPDAPTQDKQVTIPVPEDRLPEFYAFYARFLAADRPGGRRGRHRGRHGHGPGHRGPGCRTRHEDAPAHEATTGDAPATPTQDPAA